MMIKDCSYQPLLETSTSGDPTPAANAKGSISSSLWTRKRKLFFALIGLFIIALLIIAIPIALAGRSNAGTSNNNETSRAPIKTNVPSLDKPTATSAPKPTNSPTPPATPPVPKVEPVLEWMNSGKRYWAPVTSSGGELIKGSTTISGFTTQDLMETFGPLEPGMTGKILEHWRAFNNTPENLSPLLSFLQEIDDIGAGSNNASSVFYRALWDTLTNSSGSGSGRAKKSKTLTLQCWVKGSVWGDLQPSYITFYAIKVGSWYYVDMVKGDNVMAFEIDHRDRGLDAMTRSEFQVSLE